MNFIVVDANGNRFHRPKKYTTPPSIKPNLSPKSLSDLEDAIFEDGPSKRIQFLMIYKNLENEEVDDMEQYLLKHNMRKQRALLNCWQKLGWRPNKKCTMVLDVNTNPYIK